MATAAKKAADNVLPLYINGLSGRMLRLPPKPRKKREILVIAGHHTKIERMEGLAEFLNGYGAVTIPDIPGFGGMESFYKIGRKPTVDNLADYLAAFVKLRFRNRRITIIAVSFGFVLVTRMLQKYPEIAQKVDLLVSVSGFTDKDDFKWKRSSKFILQCTTFILSGRLQAAFGRYILFRGPIIRSAYRIVDKKHPKMKSTDIKQRDERINFEIGLWQSNDVRTRMYTWAKMLRLRLPKTHINLAVYHVAVKDDHYFNQVAVEEHMRGIYKDFELIKIKIPAHAPTVIATAAEMSVYVPPRVRQLLRKKSG